MTTRGLPYDILETIFSLLDKKSLLSVTLASRELNELASRSLYSSVIFNKNVKYGYGRVDRYPIRRSNPFFAFDRRPLLRNVVRQVVLCTSTPPTYGPLSNDWIEVFRRCRQELSSLRNVEAIYLNQSLCRGECERYSHIMGGLPRLRQVIMFPGLAAGVIGALPNVKSFDIIYFPNHPNPSTCKAELSKIASRVHKVFIRTGPQYWSTQDSYQLAPFKNLKVLIFQDDKYHSPIDICKSVADLPYLYQLSFSCDLADPRQTTYPNGTKALHRRYRLSDISPTGLCRLVDLRVKVLPKDMEGFGGILYAVVLAIAGASRLKRLDITSADYPPVLLECDELVAHVVSAHRLTLETLKIPTMKPSLQALRQLLVRSTHLSELWFCLDQNMKDQLPEQLKLSPSISILRLYGSGAWIFGFAEALIQQGYGSLREVQVYEYRSVRWGDHLNWIATWEYDEVDERSLRRVHGPLKEHLQLTPKTPKVANYERTRRYRHRKLVVDTDLDFDFKFRDEPSPWERRITAFN